ncbi:MAG: PLP-dependent transferase [Lachnospiraceae bacterium]|nr:PLP-dependent transferase [Lachnospiraceae bacterium]
MERSILYRQIRDICETLKIPMHMPGHKRVLHSPEELPWQTDLTEIEGADDLHHAEGILRDAMDRTAGLYKSRRTFYLVNGSTCGILSGLRALVPDGGRAVLSRNCHRSVTHAAELGRLNISWLFPDMDEDYAVCGSIRPAQVEQALEEAPDAAAVLITSPTYEGVLSDIRGIAEICHSRGVPLMVDEAHGAHLGLFREGGFPEGALRCGADVVVQSPHKTLSSLTQTAFLHVQGDLADTEEIERQLAIFETSSPSYPLMISLDSCTGLLRESGRELFSAWGEAIDSFDAQTAGLRYLRALGHGSDDPAAHPAFFALDRSKILIGTAAAGMTGLELARILRTRFRIETEMSSGNTVLAMTGCGDGLDGSGLEALGRALRTLDEEIGKRRGCGGSTEKKTCREKQEGASPGSSMGAWGEPALPIWRCVRTGREMLSARQALNRISAEYVYCYPPGIPFIVPGERITEQVLARIRAIRENGGRVRHSAALCNEGAERFACMTKG